MLPAQLVINKVKCDFSEMTLMNQCSNLIFSLSLKFYSLESLSID